MGQMSTGVWGSDVYGKICVKCILKRVGQMRIGSLGQMYIEECITKVYKIVWVRSVLNHVGQMCIAKHQLDMY